MKSLSHCVLAALVILSSSLSLAPSVAEAKSRDLLLRAPATGSWRAGIRGSGLVVSDTGVYALGEGRQLAGGELSVDRRLLDDVWLGVSWVGRGLHGDVYESLETDLEVNDLKASVMWRMPGDTWWKPYGRLAGGYRWLHTAWSTGDHRVVARERTWVAQGALGLDMMLGFAGTQDHFGMGFSIEMAYEQSGEMALQSGGMSLGDLDVSGVSWTAGLTFQF